VLTDGSEETKMSKHKQTSSNEISNKSNVTKSQMLVQRKKTYESYTFPDAQEDDSESNGFRSSGSIQPQSRRNNQKNERT